MFTLQVLLDKNEEGQLYFIVRADVSHCVRDTRPADDVRNAMSLIPHNPKSLIPRGKMGYDDSYYTVLNHRY
jgi:hypothetical protein